MCLRPAGRRIYDGEGLNQARVQHSVTCTLPSRQGDKRATSFIQRDWPTAEVRVLHQSCQVWTEAVIERRICIHAAIHLYYQSHSECLGASGARIASQLWYAQVEKVVRLQERLVESPPLPIIHAPGAVERDPVVLPDCYALILSYALLLVP